MLRRWRNRARWAARWELVLIDRRFLQAGDRLAEELGRASVGRARAEWERRMLLRDLIGAVVERHEREKVA